MRGQQTLAQGMFWALDRANDPKNSEKGPWDSLTTDEAFQLYLSEAFESFEAIQDYIDNGGCAKDAMKEIGDVIFTGSMVIEKMEAMK